MRCAIASLLLHAVAPLSFNPAPLAGARAGVISRLVPGLPQISSRFLPRSTFSQKRLATIRWRTAQSRSAVQRATREIRALERLGSESVAPRIAELRLEAGLAESRIILLKQKQRQMGVPSRPGVVGDLLRFAETFLASEERSARVLLRALSRVRDPWSLIREDTISLVRLGTQPQLVAGYAQLRDASLLAPHAAAIAARVSKLERFAPGILLAVDGHLEAVEPHLDDILERLDEIEPHLPFVLQHLDILAPHCGPLLKHVDALLLYADDGGKYLEPLLPYVPRFAPLLDQLGPHLALLRPHMRALLPHMPVIAPSAYKYARQLTVSANADILLYYFGWVLRIPKIGRWVLQLPFMPALAAFLCKVLPRRPVRGRTCDYYCDWDGCDLAAFTSEQVSVAASATARRYLDGSACAALWGESYDRKRSKMRGTSALIRRMDEAAGRERELRELSGLPQPAEKSAVDLIQESFY